MTFELWAYDDHDTRKLVFFQSSKHRPHLPSSARRIWACHAVSYIDAMTQYHAHMGWEPYQPMLDESGQPYPADLEPDAAT